MSQAVWLSIQVARATAVPVDISQLVPTGDRRRGNHCRSLPRAADEFYNALPGFQGRTPCADQQKKKSSSAMARVPPSTAVLDPIRTSRRYDRRRLQPWADGLTRLKLAPSEPLFVHDLSGP